MINFVLIGVGGYVAPRHLAAIKAVGGNLLAALDKHDSVGVLDSYFPDCDFFTEFEIFERHCNKLQLHSYTKIDYVVVCSPNYLHDAHCRFGLRIGADVICEKPLCLNVDNAYDLQIMEQQKGRRVWNILQLRLHPEIIRLKTEDVYFNPDVALYYITARGNWYHHSWKGDVNKSGGICMNIGIHFFDMLIYLFGDLIKVDIQENSRDLSCGRLQLENAYVRWFLSTNRNDLEDKTKSSFRKMTIDAYDVDFTDGFTDLHTKSYEEILAGRGFGIEDALPAIKLVNKINNFKNDI